MSTWLYLKNGTQAGPVSTDDFRGLLAAGTVRGDTLVWRDGLASWTAAQSVADFAGSIPAPAATTTTAAAAAPLSDAEDIEKNKVFAIISYLPPFLFLVPLIAARQSKFAMYHCNQGLILTLFAIGAWFVKAILGFILVMIPFLGWFLLFVLHIGIFIGIVALAIIGLLNASKGLCKPLPLIGRLFTLVK